MNKVTHVAILSLAFLIASTLLGCQTAPAAPTAVPPAPTKATAPAPTQAPVPATQIPQAQATSAPAAAPETLKVGISMGITGPAARNSLISERFFRLAIDDLNAKGGVRVGGKTYRMEAVTVDDKFTSDGGRSAADRLVLAEKVKVILGPGSAQATAGAQAVTEPNKVLILASGAMDASLGPKFPFTIVAGVSHQRMRGPVMYDYLIKSRPDAKRVAFFLPDDALGRGYGAIIEDMVKERNLSLVAREYWTTETKDFNPIVTRGLQQKPDIVDLGGSSSNIPAYSGIARALYDQGFRQPFIATWGTAANLQVGAAADGFTFPVMADRAATIVPANVRDIIERFVKKYGESETEPSSVMLYDTPMVLAQAMERAGTVDDTEKIAKVLREGEWNSVFGKARVVGAKTFGLPSVLETPIFLTKVEGGKFVTFHMAPGTLP